MFCFKFFSGPEISRTNQVKFDRMPSKIQDQSEKEGTTVMDVPKKNIIIPSHSEKFDEGITKLKMKTRKRDLEIAELLQDYFPEIWHRRNQSSAIVKRIFANARRTGNPIEDIFQVASGYSCFQKRKS